MPTPNALPIRTQLLRDPDSQASQVRAFLRSVEPQVGNDFEAAAQAGRDLIADYVLTLAEHGDNAPHPLTVREVASVLCFLRSVEAKPGRDHYAAGGPATCGHLHVVGWLEQSLLSAVQ